MKSKEIRPDRGLSGGVKSGTNWGEGYLTPRHLLNTATPGPSGKQGKGQGRVFDYK